MQLEIDDGIELHVQELGQGPPLIMLHGLLLGNMATWYWTAAPELARTHRVILFDLRGHGRSQRTATGYDVERMTSDLESLIVRLTDEPVSIIGHSYGALVGLNFALRHPDRVRKLAVVEAPLPPSSFSELDVFLNAPEGELVRALPEAIRAKLAARGRQSARFVQSVRFLAEQTSLVSDLRSAADVPDAVLARLRCPLLAVYGTDSSCRPTGQRLARVVPGASLIEMSGGHFLPLELPRALTGVLRRFIDA
jgi:pimeloyl-ACP methyl ester carboxylesterase